MRMQKYQEFKLNENNVVVSKTPDVIINYFEGKGFGSIIYEIDEDDIRVMVMPKFVGKYITITKDMNEKFGWFIYGYTADYEETETNPEHMSVDGSDIEYGLKEWIKDGAEEDQEQCIIIFRPKQPPKVNNLSVVYTIVDSDNYNPIENGIKIVESKSRIPNQILCSSRKGVENLWREKEYEDYGQHVLTVAIDCSNIDMHMCSIITDGVATYEEIPPENIIYVERL